MSNQPAPTRPWFRLLSISRSPLQEPSPTPKQATFRPTFRPAEGGVSSVPTSPVGRASQPSSPADKRTTYPLKTTTTSSLPSSPAKRALTTTPVTSSLTQKPASPVTTTTHMPSPKASSTTTVRSAIHNQIQSPQAKPARPPTQSKTQSEAESNTMLVQKTIDNPQGMANLCLSNQKDLNAAKEKGRGKKYSSDSEDAGRRIRRITSNNEGVFMNIMQSPHKNVFQGSPHLLQKNANSEAAGEYMMSGG